MKPESRSWWPRSLSLSAQLLISFVVLVSGTTLVLTVVAYRSSLENIEETARREVRATAQAREQMLTQFLTLHQQRAEGFLLGVESICGEPAGARGFGWSEDCVRTMVGEFLATQHASGALLTYRGRRLASSGKAVERLMPEPGALARVTRRYDGGTDLLMTAVRGDALLTWQFDSRDLLPMFEDRSGLGRTGEVFLAGPDGQFLTPSRYERGMRTPPGVDVSEPLDACRDRAGETVGPDYRGVRTFHGYRPVAVLGGACVDAHIAYDEALEPAEAQRADLVLRGASFVMIGALLSLVAAGRIAAPVRRLALSARALQAGQFDRPVPITGPTEVQALGRALSAMAGDLAKLVAREQAARREAESANRSKDQFLAMLSHELRTPLNAILGWARLLRTGDLDQERAQRAIGAIERSAEAQRRLIEDLLDVSRIVSGRLRMIRSATRLAAVTEAALDAVRPRADEKGVRIETSIEDGDLIVLGDPQRLQQVMWNLVWNAVKFTPAGGLVHVSLRRVANSAEITVADTGIGIAPELLPHVFEWFKQSDAAGRSVESGLGLGLGLVRQLVELHGGAVRAESRGMGEGATFIVVMPLHQADADVPHINLRTGGGVSVAGVHVLLVDDDSESREMAEAVLEEAGADVRTARSADDARAVLEAWTPDILISDIAMPREDGYQLLRSLRADGNAVPAIALTSYARREDAELARAAGFQVHMPKPIDPQRLITVAAALATEHARG